MRRLTIAIDGPGSSGKGTVARGVAKALGYRYIDTGAMYRAVAWAAGERGVSTADAEGVAVVACSLTVDFRWDGESQRVLCGGGDITEVIRSEDIGAGASAVSVHPRVRAALLDAQRALAAGGGVVMDGRDIGTVVLPDADVKVFLDAALVERARRRHAELEERGETVTLEQIMESLRARDDQDTRRAAAPLRPASDARRIDSTKQTAEEVISVVLALVEDRLRAGDQPADPDVDTD